MSPKFGIFEIVAFASTITVFALGGWGERLLRRRNK
jgi:hypothetical protein